MSSELPVAHRGREHASAQALFWFLRVDTRHHFSHK